MKKFLFVCTGNTCRSPMAMAVFNSLCREKDIPAEAFSAGLHTEFGLPYSQDAVAALAETGISLAGSSRPLSPELLEECDCIFGLTYAISTSLVAAFPTCSDKIYRFPAEVSDPFGGDLAVYRRCLTHITEGIGKIIDAVQAGKL